MNFHGISIVQCAQLYFIFIDLIVRICEKAPHRHRRSPTLICRRCLRGTNTCARAAHRDWHTAPSGNWQQHLFYVYFMSRYLEDFLIPISMSLPIFQFARSDVTHPFRFIPFQKVVFFDGFSFFSLLLLVCRTTCRIESISIRIESANTTQYIKIRRHYSRKCERTQYTLCRCVCVCVLVPTLYGVVCTPRTIRAAGFAIRVRKH